MTHETAIALGLFVTRIQTLDVLSVKIRCELSAELFGIIYDIEIGHGVVMPESREDNIARGLAPFLRKYGDAT